jgi:hypothetical protein
LPQQQAPLALPLQQAWLRFLQQLMPLRQQDLLAQHDFAYAVLMPREAEAAMKVAAQARVMANALTLLIRGLLL